MLGPQHLLERAYRAWRAGSGLDIASKMPESGDRFQTLATPQRRAKDGMTDVP